MAAPMSTSMDFKEQLQFPIKRIVIHIKYRVTYRLWKKCIVTPLLSCNTYCGFFRSHVQEYVSKGEEVRDMILIGLIKVLGRCNFTIYVSSLSIHNKDRNATQKLVFFIPSFLHQNEYRLSILCMLFYYNQVTTKKLLNLGLVTTFHFEQNRMCGRFRR